MIRWLPWVAGLTWMVSLGACAHDPAESATHHVRDLMDSAQAPYVSQGPASTAFISGRRFVPVLTSALLPGIEPFQVLARETQLAKAPCGNCHALPVSELDRKRPANQPLAHWAVTLRHAPENVMTCATCHAGDTPGQLRLLGGAGVSIDHAYQVCAQCHSTQAADWAGGAHGKRAGGWAPPRISFNCTECHNPHQPAFAPRWPSHAGRIP
jgi:hypothetical protein